MLIAEGAGKDKKMDDVEMKLDEADRMAESTEERLNHEDVFQRIRSGIHGR